MIVIFFPGMLHDAFLEDLSPLRLFPISSCCLGVIFTRDAFQTYLKHKHGSPPEPLPDAFLEEKGISSREKEVIQLLLQGYSNARVAETLFISNNTVKTHARNIFRKLGVASRYELLTLPRQATIRDAVTEENHPKG